MKTIYALYWTELVVGDETVVSTSWCDTLAEGEENYKSLDENGCDPILFSFAMGDDATDDDINEVLADFVMGRTHMVDIGAKVH